LRYTIKGIKRQLLKLLALCRTGPLLS
jgi:hypothetical protein